MLSTLGCKSQCLPVLVKMSTYVSLPPGLLGRHPSNESFLCQAQGLALPGSLQSSPQPTQLLWGQHLTSHLTGTGSHEAVTPLLQVGNLGTHWGLRSSLEGGCPRGPLKGQRQGHQQDAGLGKA